MRAWFVIGGIGFALAMPGAARAQEAGLYHAQAGALLTYAETEARVLYAALSAKEFDLELTRAMIDELNRSIGDAKRSVDRTSALLNEKQQKMEPELKKLREDVRTAEEMLNKLASDVTEQIKTKPSDDEGGGEGPEEDKKVAAAAASAPPAPNWQLLKDDASWLDIDLSAAKSLQAKLAKGVDTPSLAPPPKPKGKR